MNALPQQFASAAGQTEVREVAAAPTSAPICLAPEFVLRLLEEIGRHRALADHETDIVELIVCRGHRSASIKVRWTKPMDRRLLHAATRKGGIQLFAKQNSIAAKAAYDRLHKLRKAKRTSNGQQG